MSALHPVAELVFSSLVPGVGPDSLFALRRGADVAIVAAMDEAVAAREGADARRDTLAVVTLLQRQHPTGAAAAALRSLVAMVLDRESAAAIDREEARGERIRACLTTKLGRTMNPKAAPFDAPAPTGTVKHRDIAPRRPLR